MSTSTGKIKRMARKCNNCYVTGEEKQLFSCSKCKFQAYCSKECQRADWKKHKPMCQNNGKLESVLKEHESTATGLFYRRTLVDGMSLYELDQRLEKWVRWHHGTLMAATVQALRLPEDVTRAHTHILYAKLQPRPQAEHHGSPGKYFRVMDAEVIEMEDGLSRPSPWPESIMQLRGMCVEAERGQRGYCAAAFVECSPLYVQTVPFGSMTQDGMRNEVLHDTWKELFMDYIEEGKKPEILRGRGRPRQ
ncbi:hypothetical protein K466DRAFT_658230 [Polyporus arcularius HHB13444]|uniref:MYND-type domain-containing protein n=1 Tax=Polyporus arcularius HHB13444 TaxID=1314778 RepID=A0A5C3Q082_9APHY|nr:hypothetical protein K466DRAFT_658230 [Polyporus arcularius HHB13444]